MAVSAFNLGGGVKRIDDIAYTYKASKEYDQGAEQSWTAPQKCWVVVSVSTGAARGGGAHYIRKNGTEVSYAENVYAKLAYSYALAVLEVNKGDVITARNYQSDTNAVSYISIQAFA